MFATMQAPAQAELAFTTLLGCAVPPMSLTQKEKGLNNMIEYERLNSLEQSTKELS